MSGPAMAGPAPEEILAEPASKQTVQQLAERLLACSDSSSEHPPTLPHKKKAAVNYARWLRAAIGESHHGAIKQLLRLLPYPPEDDGIDGDDDGAAAAAPKAVVKLLLDAKLLSLLADAFDMLAAAVAAMTERDVLRWPLAHRNPETTPAPTTVLENLLGSLDELYAIHPSSVNAAYFLERIVRMLLPRGGGGGDDDEPHPTLHLRRCLVLTLTRMLAGPNAAKHASILRNLKRQNVWALFAGNALRQTDDLQHIRNLIDLYVALAPTDAEATACFQNCSADFRAALAEAVDSTASAAGATPPEERHKRSLQLAFTFNADELVEGNEVFVDACEVDASKFLSATGMQNISWQPLVQAGAHYLTLYASDASAPDPAALLPVDFIHAFATFSFRDADPDHVTLELVVPPQAVIDTHVILGNGHAIACQQPSSVAGTAAVISLTLDRAAKEELEAILQASARTIGDGSQGAAQVSSLGTPALLAEADNINASQQKLPKVSVGILPLVPVAEEEQRKEKAPASPPSPRPPPKVRPVTSQQQAKARKAAVHGECGKLPLPARPSTRQALPRSAKAKVARVVEAQTDEEDSGEEEMEEEMAREKDSPGGDSYDFDDDEAKPKKAPASSRRGGGGAAKADDPPAVDGSKKKKAATSVRAGKKGSVVPPPRPKRAGTSKPPAPAAAQKAAAAAAFFDNTKTTDLVVASPDAPSSDGDFRAAVEGAMLQGTPTPRYKAPPSPTGQQHRRHHELALLSSPSEGEPMRPFSSQEGDDEWAARVPARKRSGGAGGRATKRAKTSAIAVAAPLPLSDEEDGGSLDREMRDLFLRARSVKAKSGKAASALVAGVEAAEKRLQERLASTKSEMRSYTTRHAEALSAMRDKYSSSVADLKERMGKAQAYYNDCSSKCAERLQELASRFAEETGALEDQAKKHERKHAASLRALKEEAKATMESLMTKANAAAGKAQKQKLEQLKVLKDLLLNDA